MPYLHHAASSFEGLQGIRIIWTLISGAGPGLSHPATATLDHQPLAAAQGSYTASQAAQAHLNAPASTAGISDAPAFHSAAQPAAQNGTAAPGISHDEGLGPISQTLFALQPPNAFTALTQTV